MISVITTLFNYRNYIEECIESFLSQKNLKVESEMIIIDDGSTDHPYEIIKKYISNKIIYIQHEKNKGYSAAKNTGIINSKGQYLVMLDADDMLTPDSLSKRYNKIIQGFDLVHGPALDLCNKKTNISPLWNKYRASKTINFKFIHAQSVMLKKEIHSKIGLYDETMRYKSDREMWARIINHNFKIGTVDTPVAIYRIHELQMHKSKQKLAINKQLEQALFEKIEKRKTNLDGLIKL